MAKDQPVVVSRVIAFVARTKPAVNLTPIDRLELCAWRDAAHAAGYDRMNIHEREDGDDGEDGEFGNFLCLHRCGEAWSRWGFARKGKVITVWCCLTGADIGEFSSMTAAFEAVLPGAIIAPRQTPRRAVVTDLMPRLREAANRLGSAA